MNKDVSVTNMQVKATTEGGLLISETSGRTASDQWDDLATAKSLPASVVLLPTSTKDSNTWFHANSKSANDEAGAEANKTGDNLSGEYATLNALNHADTNAVSGENAANSVFYTDSNSDNKYVADDDSAYYVKYTYYLKTSNENGISGMGLTSGAQSLAIKNVSVTGSSNSTDLNKSLRVGVSIGSKFYIFAPLYTGEDEDTPTEYYVYNGSDATGANTKIIPLTAKDVAYTDVASLNGVTTDSPLQADVYLWYEGEDENCKSENITTTLDALTVDFKFALDTNTETHTLPTNNAYSTTQQGG